eukprot:Nk52_evm1s1997 gene=Nk52_evmTU1s1997
MRFTGPRLPMSDEIIELDMKILEERVTHAAVAGELEEEEENVRPENYKDIIRYAHEFGHFGTALTVKRIQNVLTWDTIEEDVEDVLQRCHQCH